MSRRLISIFLLPALVLYLALMIWPAAQAFYISLYETSGFADQPKWRGLGNYANLMNDQVFWLSLKNMGLILLAGGFFTFALGFIFTMFLSSGLRGKKLFRALIFMPNVIAVAAITTFWSFVFLPRYGLLTSFLKFLGLGKLASIQWTSPELVFYAMMIGLVWLSAGFFTILLLAGADKISADMFDAAKLEGASLLQQFRLITLPMIWDVIVITIVLWSIQAIKIMEFPYAFGGPNISPNLYTPAIYLFIMGFGQRTPVYQLGYATAIGVVMFLLTMAAIIAIRVFLKRDQLEY